MQINNSNRKSEKLDITKFLPTTRKELKLRNWNDVDVVLFSGDAYVDHPSFGAAVIGRVIEAEGLKVALIPQPNWQDDLRDFKKMGIPRLFFAVSAGNMDSMVNHYTANKRLRSDDAYSPDGKAHLRPDYATITYCNILKKLYPDVPVVVGGIEASLRRVTHYDYWSDRLMPSILMDSKADLLIYGMGEKPIKALIQEMRKGRKIGEITDIPQTSFACADIPQTEEWTTLTLHSHEICLKDKMKFAQNFAVVEEESNQMNAARLVQPTKGVNIVINPMYPPWSEADLDKTYRLPFMRVPHPKYRMKKIPAYEMIKFSINMHRGCFGGCAFCTISAHQGKFVVSRSKKSILQEAKALTQQPDFKGVISDLGGPSANMYKMQGKDLSICRRCKRPSCIFPKVCHNLNMNHSPLVEIYRSVDNLPNIKRSFIGSGVRYDMLLAETKDKGTSHSQREYTEELITKHVSGRLKVAPEHTANGVLKLMRKPDFSLFGAFKREFDNINRKKGLNQQLIPYFISSHPGCSSEDMAELAASTKHLDFKLEQVQDFTPTPMTLATVVYYSGYNPYTEKPVFTAKNKKDKLNQRKFFFWYKKEFRKDIVADLQRMKRQDLMKRLFE